MSKAKLEQMQDRIDILNNELWCAHEVMWNQHMVLCDVISNMKQAMYLGEITPADKFKLVKLKHTLEMLNRDICRTHIDITEALETEEDE